MARVVRSSSNRSTFLILAAGLGLWPNCQVKTGGLAVGSDATPGVGEVRPTLDLGSPGMGGHGWDAFSNTGDSRGIDDVVVDAPTVEAAPGSGGMGGAPAAGGDASLDGAGLGGIVGTGGSRALGFDASLGDVAGRDGSVERVAPPLLDGPSAAWPDVPTAYADASQADGLAVDAKDADEPMALDGKPGYTLVWSDEFSGDANSGVDPKKWTYVTWGPGHVNNERQQYTSSTNNVSLDGSGHLLLRARYNPMANNPYSSGRIETSGKAFFGPGHRIEVRAKLPAGGGSFPGIVMLGTTGSWPANGELVLMEQYGQDKSLIYVSATAGSAVGSGTTGNIAYHFADATAASTEFHLYSVDWYTDHIDFAVDGDPIVSTTYATSSSFFSIPEYLVLDVALGGTMGGDIDNAAFPMDMVVDYVRVYAF